MRVLHPWWLRPLLSAVLASSLLVAGCGGHERPLVVGAVEDSAEWSGPAAQMALARDAGFRAIVLSSLWAPPRRKPTPAELGGLSRAVDAAVAAGIRPVVAVYSFGRDTPTTARARAEFAAYAASIPRAIPQVRDVSVGNEPNASLFWRPQFGPGRTDAAATGYFRLLAETYDAVKAVSSRVNVIGGSLAARGNDRPDGRRQTHSPTSFIADLGAAYRASGRTAPLMDMFSIHPYPENSSVSPLRRHPHSRSIGVADYDKLVALLERAFGRAMPIVYGELGIETVVPQPERHLYTGTEPASTRPVGGLRQGRDYAEAIELAACQPLVVMILLFHVSDERRLAGLQSGVYYADGTPKASLPIVERTAQAAARGKLQCR